MSASNSWAEFAATSDEPARPIKNMRRQGRTEELVPEDAKEARPRPAGKALQVGRDQLRLPTEAAHASLQ